VKTLEEWIQSETVAKEKQKAAAAKAPKVENKPAESTPEKPVEKVQKVPELKAAIDPSKIKSDLFLEPEKTISNQSWLKSDSSRISKVWPHDPQSVLKQVPETSVDPGSEKKFEFDNTFRQILTE